MINNVLEIPLIKGFDEVIVDPLIFICRFEFAEVRFRGNNNLGLRQYFLDLCY